ncbi:hypothetical protein ACHWQZ_G006908 [Mnemiopsis leidyi]
MAKKNKVMKNQTRKKSENEKKINPFEVYHKKKKHSVLGVKEKRISGMPGVSRSRANVKRSQTLGVEYKKRLKKNAFVDERFGAEDALMSAEDKMMARFAVERQKHHSKQRFNLEEDVLTHKGQSLDNIEDFDDIYSSEDEDKAGPPDNTTDMHFGGFLTKSEGGTAKHMSGKDIMDEIVAKSKLQRLERQKQKEEATEETTQLDDDWTSIHGLLMPHLRPVVNTKKKDDYDIAVKSLIFEAKAKPTDRLKTDEELAKERRELLEKLEAQRLQRMKKGPNDKSELSADALLSRKVQKKSDKILVSYDEDGKMNTNEDFDKALDNLKNKNREEDSDSDDEEDASSDEEGDEEENSDEEEEGGEEEEEEEDEDEHEEDEEEGAGEVNVEAEDDDKSGVNLPLIADNFDDDEGNCAIEDVIVEEEETEETPQAEHSDLTSETTADIPFVINTPEHLSEFKKLVAGHSDSNIETIIKRIVASNHPTLKEENKEKTATFYVVLIKYLISRYGEGNLSKQVLDSSCSVLFSVTKHVQRDVYKHFFDMLNSLKHLVAKNSGKALSSVISRRYIIYLYILQRIYPTTDFKHAVLTAVLMSITWSLATCSVKKLADLKVGLFLCSFVLQTTKGRYSPEVIYFLSQVMKCLVSKSSEYVSNFKIKSDYLIDKSKPDKVSMNQLYDLETPKSDVMYALLLTVRTAMRSAHDFTGFSGVFHSISESLNLLPTDQWHPDTQSLISSLISLYSQYSQKIMPFLRYQNIKPVSIKMYEPKFGQIFVRERKDKDETKYLKKKIKTEMKGAIREIRKDNKFISRVKHKEQEGMDKARKRKVNEIMGFLSKEQGEANDLKYRKKRGQI